MTLTREQLEDAKKCTNDRRLESGDSCDGCSCDVVVAGQSLCASRHMMETAIHWMDEAEQKDKQIEQMKVCGNCGNNKRFIEEIDCEMEPWKCNNRSLWKPREVR